QDCPIHHDILFDGQHIITFTKKMHRYRGRNVDFDVIITCDAHGNILEEYSLYTHLKTFKKIHPPLELDLPKLPLLPDPIKREKPSPWGGTCDYYRLNSLQILPATPHTDSRFAPGNW